MKYLDKLMTYEGFHELCEYTHAPANVVLKVQMGDFPPGSEFCSVWFMWEDGCVDFYITGDEEAPVASLSLNVVVG